MVFRFVFLLIDNETISSIDAILCFVPSMEFKSNVLGLCLFLLALLVYDVTRGPASPSKNNFASFQNIVMSNFLFFGCTIPTLRVPTTVFKNLFFLLKFSNFWNLLVLVG